MHSLNSGPNMLEESQTVTSLTSSMDFVRTPRVARSLALLTFGVIFIFAIAMIFVPWQQTVSGSGAVTSFEPGARAQTIESVINGRIAAWYINEGAIVRKGDTIALLSDINVNFIDPLFVDRLETARDNIMLAQDAAISVALERLNQSIQALEASRAARDAVLAELTFTRVRYARARTLADSGLISQRDLETASINLNKLSNDSLRFEAAVLSARQNLEAMKSEKERVERQAEATVADAELRLGNARSRKNAGFITAPCSGQLTRVMKAGLGQSVKEGDKLATIVPFNTDIAAEIFVSGMDAALVDVGRNVTLQFAGFPALQFSGFPHLSMGVFQGRIAAVDAVDDGKGRYRLLIIPDTTHGKWASRNYLRQGSMVSGWVLLNTVPLGYELWRQLNGFPPQFPVRNQIGGYDDLSNKEESKEKK